MKLRIVIGSVLVAVVVFLCCETSLLAVQRADKTQPPKAQPKPKPVQVGQHPQLLSKKIGKIIKGSYLLYLPEEYGKTKKKWPLILFLHGSGERISGGRIHPKLTNYGLPKTLKKGTKFPFIVLTPQCPAGKWWTDTSVTEMVMAMLDEVCKKYNVDKNRIYLTGMSMGGFGTWDLAQQYPKRFAAIAPVCGGGNPFLNHRLKKVPVWVFHGAKDKKVPVKNAYEMAGRLKQMGGNVKLSVYPNIGHFVWDKVYTNPKLYEWLMQQTLASRTRRAGEIKRVKSTTKK